MFFKDALSSKFGCFDILLLERAISVSTMSCFAQQILCRVWPEDLTVIRTFFTISIKLFSGLVAK